MAKKLLIGAGAVVIIAAGGGYGAYAYYKDKMEKDVNSVFAYIAPSGKATYKTMDYDIFGDTVTLNGVELAGSDASMPTMSIDRIVVQKPMRDNVRKVFNPASYTGSERDSSVLPLAGSLVLEGIKGQKTGPYNVSLGKVIVDQPKARQFAQVPPADLSLLNTSDPDTLLEYVQALGFTSVTLESLLAEKSRKSTEADGPLADAFLKENDAGRIQVGKLVLGSIDGAMLTSFDISNVSFEGEDRALDEERKKEGRSEKFSSKLGSLTLEKVDLKAFKAFSDAIGNEDPKAIFDAFEGITIGKFQIGDYAFSVDMSRPPYEWEDDNDDWDEDENDAPADAPKQENVIRREKIDFAMKNLSVTSMEKGVLGALRIEGIDMGDIVTPEQYAKENVTYHQGLILIENVNIGQALKPMMSMATSGRIGSDDAVMAMMFDQMFSPVQAGKIEVRDIRFKETKDVGEIALEELLGSSTYKDDVLVSSESSFKGFTWTFPEKLSRWDGRRELLKMGYKDMAFSGKATESFNPEDQRYQLSFDMQGKDMGSMILKLDLGKYPRKKSTEITDVDYSSRRATERRIETLFKSIELRSVDFTYTEDLLIDKIIAYYARESGQSLEGARQEIADGMTEEVNRMKRRSDDEGAMPRMEQAVSEIARFVGKPATITFALKPEKPVLFGDAEPYTNDRTPEAMFNFLGLVTTYSEKAATP